MRLMIALAVLTFVVKADPITYDFTVTATSEPLNEATGSGTFAYDSSIIVPGGSIIGVDLLTSLSFLWDGIAYDGTTANSLVLSWDGTGNLVRAGFGNNCDVHGCAVIAGHEQWFVDTNALGGSGFVYSTPGSLVNGFGTVTVTRVPEAAGIFELLTTLVVVSLSRKANGPARRYLRSL